MMINRITQDGHDLYRSLNRKTDHSIEAAIKVALKLIGSPGCANVGGFDLRSSLRLAGLVLAAAVLYVPVMIAKAASVDQPMRVYIGTYTGAKSQGIYVCQFDSASGKLSPPELAAATKNPSFLALHPDGRFLYAVSEMDNFAGQRTGALSAFRIEAGTGQLTLLDQQSSGGAGPCHVAVDHTGQCALAANYGSGSIALLPIGDDGRLSAPSACIQHHGSSVNPQRQAGPHAHFITTDPANRLALACDLGLDKVLVYHLDPAKGALTANEPPAVSIKPGSGPRHLAFHPNGRFVYLINEIASTITVLAYDATRGALAEVQTISTLPEDFQGKSSCAEVQVHPSGRFVYGSNRGHDSIAMFSVEPGTGKLTCIGYEPTQGKNPRHFVLDPSGQWLLAENQDSDNIVVFRIEARTGRLTPAGQTIQVGSPVCGVFVPGKP